MRCREGDSHQQVAPNSLLSCGAQAHWLLGLARLTLCFPATGNPSSSMWEVVLLGVHVQLVCGRQRLIWLSFLKPCMFSGSLTGLELTKQEPDMGGLGTEKVTIGDFLGSRMPVKHSALRYSVTHTHSALPLTWEMLTPVSLSTLSGRRLKMSSTSPVTLAAPTVPLPLDTSVILLAEVRGPLISSATW